jgi:hypothetical protein
MNKPRVIGLVGVLFLRGAFSAFQAITNINDVNSVEAALVPGWLIPQLYTLLILGICSLLAAVLILMYRRLGLMLGILVCIVDIVGLALLFLGGVIRFFVLLSVEITAFALFLVGRPTIFDLSTLINLVFTLAITNYCYRYLTKEPEKAAFV